MNFCCSWVGNLDGNFSIFLFLRHLTNFICPKREGRRLFSGVPFSPVPLSLPPHIVILKFQDYNIDKNGRGDVRYGKLIS